MHKKDEPPFFEKMTADEFIKDNLHRNHLTFVVVYNPNQAVGFKLLSRLNPKKQRKLTKKRESKIYADMVGQTFFFDDGNIFAAVDSSHQYLRDGLCRSTCLAKCPSSRLDYIVVALGTNAKAEVVRDTGKTRSLGQSFKILGYDNGEELATAANILTSFILGQKRQVNLSVFAREKIMMQFERELNQTLPWIRWDKKRKKGLGWVAIYTAFAIIKKCAGDVHDETFKRWITCFDVSSSKDPEYKVWEWLQLAGRPDNAGGSSTGWNLLRGICLAAMQLDKGEKIDLPLKPKLPEDPTQSEEPWNISLDGILYWQSKCTLLVNRLRRVLDLPKPMSDEELKLYMADAGLQLEFFGKLGKEVQKLAKDKS